MQEAQWGPGRLWAVCPSKAAGERGPRRPAPPGHGCTEMRAGWPQRREDAGWPPTVLGSPRPSATRLCLRRRLGGRTGGPRTPLSSRSGAPALSRGPLRPRFPPWRERGEQPSPQVCAPPNPPCPLRDSATHRKPPTQSGPEPARLRGRQCARRWPCLAVSLGLALLPDVATMAAFSGQLCHRPGDRGEARP